MLNQSVESALWVRETGVTARTSWPATAGEYVRKPMAADQSLPKGKGECPAYDGLNQTTGNVDLG